MSNDTDTDRQWFVNATQGYPGPDEMVTKLDDAMKTFMQYYRVRNAQLAFGRNGNVEVQRAYSNTEYNTYITNNQDVFLLASVSKAFCSAAIYALYPDEQVRANTKVFTDVLGFNPQDGHMGDPRMPQITIKNLLEHKGGFNDQIGPGNDNTQSWTRSPDPTYSCREVAQFLGRNVQTITDLAEYAYRQPLDFNPGTTIGNLDFVYSNIGYLLLSRVVEVKSGQDYMSFLREKITNPLGLRMVEYRTPEDQHVADQTSGLIHAESYDSGPPAYDINRNDNVPAVYGGDGMVKEACMGCASLMCSAGDLVKFVGQHAVWDIGGHEFANRTGSTPGTSAWLACFPDGTDLAIVMNTRESSQGHYFVSSLSHQNDGSDVIDHDGNLFDFVDGPIRKILDEYPNH